MVDGLKMRDYKKVKTKKRKNAGRPAGSGPWGEKTKSIQIPMSLIPEVVDLMADFVNGRLEVKMKNHDKYAAKKQLNAIEERFYEWKKEEAKKSKKS